MPYSYKTKDTCFSKISFDLEGDVVHNIEFTGGCNGNL
ncbi:MAG: TSCPD domain-containing protein [Ruminiclostridium sp.]